MSLNSAPVPAGRLPAPAGQERTGGGGSVRSGPSHRLRVRLGNVQPSAGDAHTCDITDRRRARVRPTPRGQCGVCWLDTFLFMSTAL